MESDQLWVVVLPVKRFEIAKRRLGDGGLRSSDRVALATRMLTDVLETLKLASNVDDVVVVTGEPNAEVLARGYGAEVIADDPRRAQRRGYSRHRVGDRRGRVPRPDRWPATPRPYAPPRSTKSSRAVGRARGRDRARPPRHRHQRPAADAAGRDRAELRRRQPRAPRARSPAGRGDGREIAKIASLMLDIDTPEDLDALAEALERRPARTAAHARRAQPRRRG